MYIGDAKFESIEDIIERYLNPCNQLVKMMTQHKKKFLEGGQDYIEEILREDKVNESKIIPYYFGCFTNAP